MKNRLFLLDLQVLETLGQHLGVAKLGFWTVGCSGAPSGAPGKVLFMIVRSLGCRCRVLGQPRPWRTEYKQPGVPRG